MLAVACGLTVAQVNNWQIVKIEDYQTDDKVKLHFYLKKKPTTNSKKKTLQQQQQKNPSSPAKPSFNIGALEVHVLVSLAKLIC